MNPARQATGDDGHAAGHLGPNRGESQWNNSPATYRAIVENVADGIYQINGEGQFLRVIPAFARMLGHDSPEKRIQATPQQRTRFYLDRTPRNRLLAHVELHEEITGFEAQGLHRDSSTMWISLSARDSRRRRSGPF